ncbi:MAG: right-handed parallel beta-helix repeat-containing protein [Candidatus Hydrogenedentes bacterium]|nr:right-handed parallel beta-helix repeat-containing protein [Candidatus Hydrogenedentota bacterium]
MNTMCKSMTLLAAVVGLAVCGLSEDAMTREFHVSPQGDNTNDGTISAPLKTISAAAALAQPGDTVTVHAGLYRENIDPPRGGTSEDLRIIYQAAPGEAAEIRGSEPLTGWVKVKNDTWKAAVGNQIFRDYNPFAVSIKGDWFNPLGRPHHTGSVYLNGDWLMEAPDKGAVLKQPKGDALWYAEVGDTTTTIWAQFPGIDPNAEEVEISVRKTVFYPSQPGINYITVRGFTMRHAATQWAPPTAEQVGLIGTHWSKGWVIENNTISHSKCVGIALGKHGDEFDNTSADTAEGYVLTIERGHARGWSGENIGHHVVRNNTISDCEQAGVVGSLGAIFSTISGNTIHDIHVKRLFTGAEMAGIKIHAAIDCEISDNRIYRTVRGIWLDWMAQGTRVTRNLIYNSIDQDLFMEVNHGPFLIDNNFFLSGNALLDVSEGGAYVHNLMAGALHPHPELNRETPFHPAHSTQVAGLRKTEGGDNRFFNNIFVKDGLAKYDGSARDNHMAGNVFLGGAVPGNAEKAPVVCKELDPELRMTEEEGAVFLDLQIEPASIDGLRELVISAVLGKAEVPDLPYVNPDDSPLTVDRDYFGKPRGSNPTPGPVEGLQAQRLKLWPK